MIYHIKKTKTKKKRIIKIKIKQIFFKTEANKDLIYQLQRCQSYKAMMIVYFFLLKRKMTLKATDLKKVLMKKNRLLC